MFRNTAYVEANAQYNWGGITLIGRGDYDVKTDYLDKLGSTANLDFESYYSQADLREYYLDLYFGKRASLRLGKQQVVWGKSDFFRGMDIVHGFDYTWRSFLEVENEQLRKPLILGNLQLQVPEANGSLQFLFRPGWDRKRDVGNTYELSGGRWANQPNKGFDFLAPIPASGPDAGSIFPGVPYNYDHPAGKADDVGWGVRWAGTAGRLEYSLAYLRTLSGDPVVNTIFNPFEAAPRNGFAEFIYTNVDLFGLTLNGYIPGLDIVARTEVSLTLDQPYNIGTEFLGGALPGFAGVTRKNTMRIMAAFDKQLNWAPKVLGASRPAFFNFQFFDTWLLDYDKEQDDIVDLAGYGAPKSVHTVFLTVILAWNYNNDRINPSLAAGIDASNGGGFIIPAIEFVKGNHWRLKIEYDWFLPTDEKLPGQIEQKTHLIGYFANNSQLAARLTFQF